MTSNNGWRAGQSLIEIIIGLGIGSALIGAAVVAIVFMLRSGAVNQKFQIASGLNREILDKVRTVESANWNDLYQIYNLAPKGADSQYWVDFNVGGNNKFSFLSGTTSMVIEGVTYTEFFSVENVCRDSNDITGVPPCGGGSSEDPSTQKVTVYVTWPTGSTNAELKVADYVTRWENAVFQQTDWSGGATHNNNDAVSEPDNKFTDSDNIDFNSNPGSIKLSVP